jgi:hypothetical protein
LRGERVFMKLPARGAQSHLTVFISVT